jgi:hypothetical protein
MPRGEPIRLTDHQYPLGQDKRQKLLFGHPVLFSNMVKASLVDTLLLPEHTNKAVIAAIVVLTTGQTRINGFR